MNFAKPKYETYVFLGDPNAPPLWKWTVWKKLIPVIDPLIEAARGKAALRTSQLSGKVGKMKNVPFGQLGWNEKHHQKWSHGSPENKSISKSWHFGHFELWAPGWNQCERDDLAPDLYLGITNEAMGFGYGKQLLFNPIVIFAVTSAMAKQHSEAINAAVTAIRSLTKAKLAGRQKERAWATPIGSFFTNAICDIAATTLIRPGKRHIGEPDFHLFTEEWEAV